MTGDITKQNKKKKIRAVRRHRIMARIISFIIAPFIYGIFKFKPERFSIKNKPAVVLSNHNADLDAAFIYLSCSEHLYFVASSHIIRWRFLGKLIEYVFDPIMRRKGTTEARTAMEVLRTLRAGNSVCIFAEGNRSFNGETGMILPSTGKLVKKSGASLITYRLHGGYFSTPRWGKKMRRGGIFGKVVREYSPEEIAAMTDDEVNALIKNDLYVNAYADQKELSLRYKGKNKAEHLETTLYLCPVCGGCGTIHSSGDRAFCGCGLSMRYTEQGLLVADGSIALPYSEILDWDHWQRERLPHLVGIAKDDETLIFVDERQILCSINSNNELTQSTEGRFSMFRNRFEFTENDGETTVIPFVQIDDVDTIGRLNLSFLLDDGNLIEIHSAVPRSPVKYRDGFRFLTGKQMG